MKARIFSLTKHIAFCKFKYAGILESRTLSNSEQYLWDALTLVCWYGVRGVDSQTFAEHCWQYSVVEISR